ncbi:MAG TPA: hypothetical protein VH108_07495 [Gaiellaceae bacterium]|nr:hypothetical protein [Gaiellaceae bacterium]
MKHRIWFLLPALVALTACGSHARSSAPLTTQTSPAPATTTAPAPGAGALQAEATAAAAGDIPDNQVFVAYTGPRFAMKYPEGWAQSGGGSRVTFRDKNNIVRVTLSGGGRATAAALRSQLAGLKSVTITTAPHAVHAGANAAVEATYRTTSAPNPVTGKRVTLTVNRYELARGGSTATVDLGTPVGVDNVDAYRLMIDSFRWR